MPAWLIQLLITLAINFGLPWLLKKFPWIPPEVRKIIEDLINKLKDHKEQKEVLVSEAKQKVRECYGPNCKIN